MHSFIAHSLALFIAFSILPAQAQNCNPNIRPTSPTDKFVIDAKKGTVFDLKTGLMWKRCAEGESGTECERGHGQYFGYDEALKRAASSTFAGYRDWRLPNIKELQSLVEDKCDDPAINAEVFPNKTSLFYFSASIPAGGSATYPWFVSLSSGHVDVGASMAGVLLVRNVQ